MFRHPVTIKTDKNRIIMVTFPGSILSFDWRGNLLAEIGSRGRGPGEYQFGMYFTLDSENELFTYAKQLISSMQRPGLINDLDGGPDFAPGYCYREDGREYLLSWRNAFELKAHVESESFKNSTPKYPEKKRELEKLAASLDENDNPVLMLVKLKD